MAPWTIRLSNLAIIFLACVLPVSAQTGFFNLFAHVEPLDGDLYRVTVSGMTNDHPFRARFELQEVSDTGDTIVLEPTLIRQGLASGQTVWRWSASREITAPERVQQIEVRSEETNIILPLQRRANAPTADALRTAISHCDLVGFNYGAETIVARPQRIYRVAGDKWGSIVLCSMATAGDRTKMRSFYISQITDIHVNPIISPVQTGR